MLDQQKKGNLHHAGSRQNLIHNLKSREREMSGAAQSNTANIIQPRATTRRRLPFVIAGEVDSYAGRALADGATILVEPEAHRTAGLLLVPGQRGPPPGSLSVTVFGRSFG